MPPAPRIVAPSPYRGGSQRPPCAPCIALLGGLHLPAPSRAWARLPHLTSEQREDVGSHRNRQTSNFISASSQSLLHDRNTPQDRDRHRRGRGEPGRCCKESSAFKQEWTGRPGQPPQVGAELQPHSLEGASSSSPCGRICIPSTLFLVIAKLSPAQVHARAFFWTVGCLAQEILYPSKGGIWREHFNVHMNLGLPAHASTVVSLRKFCC